MRILIAAVTALFAITIAHAETVTFSSADGVTVTADLTRPSGETHTALVLFHMAGSSRGEYADIAPQLAKLGYLTLAVDQRSGGSFDGVRNETAAHVKGSADYADAIPDLQAATAYARGLGVEKVGVIGSSYSASLVLVLAGEDRGFADAVASFSPGEYFSGRGYVAGAATKIDVPVFITGAGGETPQWAPIADAIKSPVVRFENSGGQHGASALTSSEGGEYMAALQGFLAQYLPAK